MSFKNQTSPFCVEFFCRVFEYFVWGAKAHKCNVLSSKKPFGGLGFPAEQTTGIRGINKDKARKNVGSRNFFLFIQKKELKPYV